MDCIKNQAERGETAMMQIVCYTTGARILLECWD